MAEKEKEARVDLWMGEKGRKGKNSATYWSILQQEFADKMAEEMALHAKEKSDFEPIPLGEFMFAVGKIVRKTNGKMVEAWNRQDYKTAMRMCVHSSNYSFMMFQKLRAISGQLSPGE